jgi:hypothetical protein
MTPQEAYKTLDLAKGLGMDRVEAQFTKLKAEMESKIASTSNERLKQVYSNRLNEIEEAYAALIEHFEDGAHGGNGEQPIAHSWSSGHQTKESDSKWLLPAAIVTIGAVVIGLVLFLTQTPVNEGDKPNNYLENTNEEVKETKSDLKNNSTEEEIVVHERIIELPLGERVVNFSFISSESNDISSSSSQQILILSIHSDELASRKAARSFVKNNPEISYVEIDGGGKRRIFLRPNADNISIDPNRMFTRYGIEKDLIRSGEVNNYDVELIYKFSQSYVNKFLNTADIIIAVHNNASGGYSIKSYLAGGAEASSASQVSMVSGQNEDNFYLVTTQDLFDKVQDLGYNVVLQSNQPADDGSLSVFCAKKGISYINLEVLHGEYELQLRMLEDLVREIKSDY